MIVDYGVSSDCINLHSYGNICIRCGCCSYNPNYRDKIIKCIRYYKEMLKEKESFNGWFYAHKKRNTHEMVYYGIKTVIFCIAIIMILV